MNCVDLVFFHALFTTIMVISVIVSIAIVMLVTFDDRNLLFLLLAVPTLISIIICLPYAIKYDYMKDLQPNRCQFQEIKK